MDIGTAGIARITWPLRALPPVTSAGRFPLDDADFETTYRGPTHALHLYEYRGCMRLCGREVPLAPGVLTISPAGRPTAYNLPAPGYHLCIHFIPVRGGPTAALPVYLALGPRREFVAQRIHHIADLFASAGGREGALALAAAAAATQELLLYVAGIANAPRRPANPTRAESALTQLLSILHEDLAQPLDVPDLAQRVGLSQNYLARQFHRRLGVTIQRYVLARRIEAARQLLTITNLPVGRIAARVGLPDAQHFNKQFRRLTGVSPSAARHAAAREGQDTQP
jgi:AraC-like DNA-binding protein